MAERQIGLRIKLNGLNTVISDIQTLEDELRKAKEDLKQIEIGSATFNELSQEIAQSQRQLDELNRSTQALGTEKVVEGFSKLGGGISSAFAAATAAVNIFGAESEDASKAAADAQNLLTIALSIRGAAEIKTGAQIVAKTIADRAATAATLATNAATKALFTTLAANPYGAILAAVGLLVTAYFSLKTETEEVGEKTKTLTELQIEASKAAVQETNKLKILQEILNDSNVSLEAKRGAYEQLKKLVPTLNNLTLEQAQAQGILNSEINKEITLIELRAKQKALEGFIQQEEEKQIKKNIQARDQYIKTLSVELNQERLRLLQAGVARDEVEKTIQFITQQKLATQDFQDVRTQLKNVTAEITKLENQQTTTIQKQEKAVKSVTAADEERKKQREALIDLLGKQAKLQAELLVQSVALGEADVKVIDTLQKKVDAAKKYEDSVNRLKTIQQLLIDLDEELLPVQDKVGDAFSKATDAGEAFFDSIKNGGITQEEVIKKGTELQETLAKIGKEFDLDEENIKKLERYALNYQQFTDAVNKFQTKSIVPPFDAAKFEKDLVDVLLLTDKIKIDPYSLLDPSNPNYRDPSKLQSELLDAQERLQKDQEGFIKSYVELRKKEVDLTKFSTEEQKRLVASYEEAGKVAFQNLVNVGNEVIIFENGVEKVRKKVQDLNAELAKLEPTARRGFIIENAEQIADEYSTVLSGIAESEEELSKIREKLRKKDFSYEEKYGDALQKLQKSLLKQNIDISTLTYAEKLALLEKFLAKEVEATKTAEQKKQEEFQQTINDISKGLSIFQETLGTIASLTAQSFQIQQDALENSYKKTLDSIVGDTEESNEKRAELEKQFQAEKAELEKQARIKSLQFQLVQAIADGAQAVLKTLAEYGGTPLGIGLSIATGILTAFQVDLIRQQLAQARSFAGGGMVRGRAHEFGGVMVGGGMNLEGGETILNRQTSMDYLPLLSTLNQQGGGSPIVSNASGSLMEERIIQAIARQRQEPIRAYVLGQEITNSQAINKRLDELSTL